MNGGGIAPEDTAARLLAWYRAQRRDLPWRRTRDPWAIWVSEVMLQQTRVEHVVSFFQPFLDRFPNPAALATAPLDEALARWSGLGYYRRLRLLHRAAKEVVAMGGTIPSEPAALRALPGVGDYTAAAVASIAFGRAVAVLDGNVERVLARRLACAEDTTRAAVKSRLRAAAAELLDPAAAGESNQALMELGATVCAPRAPRCGACPIAAGCLAGESGSPEAFPRPARRQQPRRVSLLVAVVARGSRVLLFRRGEDERLLAGTWELPWIETTAGEAEAAVAGAADSLGERYGGQFVLGEELGRVRHAITTRRLTATVCRARCDGEGAIPGCAVPGCAVPEGGVAEGREARWVERSEIATLATSSLVAKALALAFPAVRPTARRRG